MSLTIQDLEVHNPMLSVDFNPVVKSPELSIVAAGCRLASFREALCLLITS